MEHNHNGGKLSHVFAICFVLVIFVTGMITSSCTQELSGYKDAVEGKISSLLSQIKSESKADLPQLNPDLPHGTYTANWWPGIEGTASFSGNTLTLYNKFEGKRIFECSFPGGIGSGRIQLKNVVTNKVSIDSFQYNKQYDCVTLHDITYYK